MILPDVDDINYSALPEMSWFKAQIPWGYLDPDSYADWIEKFSALPLFPDDVGNDPPPSPAYRAGWNGVGSAGGYTLY